MAVEAVEEREQAKDLKETSEETEHQDPKETRAVEDRDRIAADQDNKEIANPITTKHYETSGQSFRIAPLFCTRYYQEFTLMPPPFMRVPYILMR